MNAYKRVEIDEIGLRAAKGEWHKKEIGGNFRNSGG